MQYNCLIADDNIIEQDLVALYINKIPSLNLVAVCQDGTEAAEILAREPIDIVFSDIDMPGISGINLLKGLKTPPVFVFITSFTEYAVESFELDAVDYVVKPLTFERFYQAANKAIEYIEIKRILKEQPAATISEAAVPTAQPEHFFIKQAHNITKLKYTDVLYIESMGDFSKIFTADGEYYITLVSLKNMEQQLPLTFFRRIHRQFIVNTGHIVTLGSSNIILNNKQHIPVGESYRQGLVDHVVDNQKVIGRYNK